MTVTFTDDADLVAKLYRTQHPLTTEEKRAYLEDGIMPIPDFKIHQQSEADKARVTHADALAFAREHWTFAMADNGKPVAIPRDRAEANIARPLSGLAPAIRRKYRETHNGKAPSDAVTEAVVLELADEVAESEPIPLALRAAAYGDGYVIDLGTADCDYVKVTANRWDVYTPAFTSDIDRPVFRRPRAFSALPIPERGGSRDELAKLLALDPDSQEFRVVWGWLVNVFREDIVRPALLLTGNPGSGKTTRAECIVNLIDPVTALHSGMGHSREDDIMHANARYIFTDDNQGSVSKSTSDWFCTLITGGAMTKRALYTDDEALTLSIRRTAVLTSIVPPLGFGADAVQRMVRVDFAPFEDGERRSERELREALAEARPRIIGAILSDLATVLAGLGDVPTPRDASRTVDYERGLIALDNAEGYDEGNGYRGAYRAAMMSALSEQATEDPIYEPILKVLKLYGGTFEGTAAELLAALDKHKPSEHERAWPTTPRGLTSILGKLYEPLKAAGIFYTPSRRSHGKSLLKLASVVPLAPADEPAELGPAAVAGARIL